MPLRAVLLSLALGVAGCLLPAVAAPLDARRGDLDDLREKIRSLQDDIQRAETSHHEAADELAGAEKAISGAQRQLREIRQRRGEMEAEVARLRAEETRLAREVAAWRKQLGETLYRLYVEGGQGGTRRLLSGDNPNQIARDGYYLERIARQRAEAVAAARASVTQLAQVRETAEARHRELLELEQAHQAQRNTLEVERGRQRSALTKIASELQGQRQQMKTLQQNEARMEKLIQGLERIAQQQAEARARAEASRDRESQRANDRAGAPARAGKGREEPVTGRASVLPEAETGGAGFAARKGALGWPVKGAVKGRFGAARAEGGTTWHGVFIQAANGSEVRAVAAGRIVFADWLRGFGNVVIVDHGDGYMSVYGNNESLLHGAGVAVRGGDVLATVGSSGGQDESGLYFEIRYRGQPQDPARWMAAR
ncbi:MAG: peptidoglycan DD-metalloendopeptidase family protein [Candidatus Dactylopiibacterium sp.]|nr:peptidoglycan DD-metalloendopeptidase family protein [Candidatus Dactylopiibacterium sp.]